MHANGVGLDLQLNPHGSALQAPPIPSQPSGTVSRDAALVAELAAKGGVTLFQKIGPREGWKRPLPARSGYEHGLNKFKDLAGNVNAG